MTSGDNNIKKSGKFDIRVEGGDENKIGSDTKIHGISILGNDRDNINDNTVLRNSDNTKSNIDGRRNENLALLLEKGIISSDTELDCRLNCRDKNIIGDRVEIKGDSIVGDGDRNMNMYKSAVERKNTMNESVAESKITMNSNKKPPQQQHIMVAAAAYTIKSAPTTD